MPAQKGDGSGSVCEPLRGDLPCNARELGGQQYALGSGEAGKGTKDLKSPCSSSGTPGLLAPSLCYHLTCLTHLTRPSAELDFPCGDTALSFQRPLWQTVMCPLHVLAFWPHASPTEPKQEETPSEQILITFFSFINSTSAFFPAF